MNACSLVMSCCCVSILSCAGVSIVSRVGSPDYQIWFDIGLLDNLVPFYPAEAFTYYNSLLRHVLKLRLLDK